MPVYYIIYNGGREVSPGKYFAAFFISRQYCASTHKISILLKPQMQAVIPLHLRLFSAVWHPVIILFR